MGGHGPRWALGLGSALSALLCQSVPPESPSLLLPWILHLQGRGASTICLLNTYLLQVYGMLGARPGLRAAKTQGTCGVMGALRSLCPALSCRGMCSTSLTALGHRLN